MNRETANILNDTTTAFYAAQAASFSATRQSAWPGWQRLKNLPNYPLIWQVLDVACGNGRFRQFLQQEMPQVQVAYRGVDSCAPLAGGEVEQRDIVTELLDGSFDLGKQEVDLTVCFGFFHHVPGAEARQRLLRTLCAATKPGGLVALSLWRFMDEPGLAAKAQASTVRALGHFACQGVSLELDENDYLLGWQTQQKYFRYAHHFTEAEADALVAAAAPLAALEDRFLADGRTGALNEYLVFRVK